MFSVELEVGETTRIGNCLITVLDIQGDEIFFQIETPDLESTAPSQPEMTRRPPK